MEINLSYSIPSMDVHDLLWIPEEIGQGSVANDITIIPY
jgi:hypothetical protein